MNKPEIEGDVRQTLDAMEAVIDDKEAALKRHGVLDGEKRLELDKLRERHAHLKGKLDDGPSPTAAETLAAETNALHGEFSDWVARTDRAFKA